MPAHVNTLAVTTAVDNLLAAQSSPECPSFVSVSQPSAALTAAPGRPRAV